MAAPRGSRAPVSVTDVIAMALRAVAVDDCLDLSQASEGGRSVDEELTSTAKMPDLDAGNSIGSELLLECPRDRRREEFRVVLREFGPVPEEVAPNVTIWIEQDDVQRDSDGVRTDLNVCCNRGSKGGARILRREVDVRLKARAD